MSKFVEGGEAEKEEDMFDIFQKNMGKQEDLKKTDANKSLQYSIVDRIINLEKSSNDDYDTSLLGQYGERLLKENKKK